jgi:hypothetical protein
MLTPLVASVPKFALAFCRSARSVATSPWLFWITLVWITLDYAGLQRNPAAADVCEVFCLRGPRGLGKTLFAAFGAALQGCGFAILAPVKTVVVFDSV